MLLPPPQMMLKPPAGLPKVPSSPPPGVTEMLLRLPGAPSTKRFEPWRTREVLACLSLPRLTSTKRMSVCTWLGTGSASRGSSRDCASDALAVPST
ncbi:hypothetical protein D9M71_783560 [compost metagenome]